MLITLFTDKPR